jgi:hypothetical protein
MTFDDLIDKYGETFSVSSSYSQVANDIVSACDDLIKRVLVAEGKKFKFIGELEFSSSIESLAVALRDANLVNCAASISPLFQSENAIKNFIYSYDNQDFENILVLSIRGLYNGDKNLYDELTSFSSSSRPITINDSKIVINPKMIKEKCVNHIESFKINVNGKKIVGESYEEDILLHGNQILRTEVEDNITYNIEKSGDLPADKEARENMILKIIEKLNQQVSLGEVSRYEVVKQNRKTLIKTYFKELEDYNVEFNVDTII